MKKFVVKVILLGIALFIPLIVADILKTKDYRSRNYYPFTTWTDIVEGRLDSDTWILGSSRALMQYNPRILDSLLDISSYNLGCNAQFIFLDLQCYQIARAFNSKPKYILLDLTWQSLTMNISPISRYGYMPYITNYKFRHIVKDNPNLSYTWLNMPYYRYYVEKNNDDWYENFGIKQYKGYKAVHIKWDGGDMNILDTVHYQCEPEAISLLNDFLQECNKDSITVILIYSPFYIKGFEKIHNHKQMMDMFQGIADQNDIPFLDYTHNPISYDTSNFYNAMHLNSHGEDLFSVKLAHDLDSLGLIPARQ